MTRTLLLALLLCLSNYGVSLAQGTFRWTGTGTDWQSSVNWELVSTPDFGSNGYPDGNDNAVFDVSYGTPGGPLTNIPAWDGNFTINGFTGTVQIGANFECNGTVTLTTGTLQVNSGFNFLAGTLTINGGTLTLNNPGDQHNLGTVSLSSGTFNGSGAGNINVVTILQSGGAFNAGGATYTFDAVAVGPGTGTINTPVFSRTGGTFNAGTSTFVVAANTSGSGSGTRSATATLNADVATTLNNLTIKGNNTSGSGGTRTRVVAFTGSGTFTIAGTLRREENLTNITGTNLQYATGATLDYNLGGNSNPFAEWPASSGPTNVTKRASNTLTLNVSRTIPLGGVLDLQAGTFTVASGNTLTINGALKRSGGSLTVSGTLSYGASGTQTVDGQSFTGAVAWYSVGATIGDEFPASPSIPNLLITTSGTVSGSASRTVRGRLRISSGTLDLGSNTITVLGDITGSSVSGSATIANNTTLNLGGGSSSTLAQTIGGSLTLNKLTIDKQNPALAPWDPNNTVTVEAAGTVTFTANGNLTITNGTLSFGASSNLVGTNLPTLTLNLQSNGIIKTGGQPLGQIASTSGTFTANGKVVFNGSATETFPRDRTIARIEIANSNNVQVDNTANNTVTVTDSLIFTSGRITQTNASNYLFVIGSGCVVTGSGYVDGSVRRVFPTTGSGDGKVPTGKSTGTNPGANWIQLSFSSGTGSATLRFEQFNANIGGATSGTGWSGRSTTRYWTMEVVSGSISSPSYGIRVQKANSGVATPLGRILRATSVAPASFESSYATGQTDDGTEVFTPNNAYNDFLLAFTIVRDIVSQLIWGGQISNDWNTANNWWLPDGSPGGPPSSTSNVIINGIRPSNVNTVTGDATVVLSSTGNCASLTVGDTTGSIISTLRIQATLNVGTGYQPANTTYGQNSTISWENGSGGVQADVYQNLRVDNGSALGTQGTGSITVNGNMTKQGSGTFTPASGNSITVEGDYTNTAGDANYSNASLTLSQYSGRTFTLTSGTVSGTVSVAAQTITLSGGTMSANLTLNGSSTQTIGGTGATNLASLTVTNGNEVNFGSQTRTVVGNVTLSNSSGTLTSGTLRMAGTSAQTIGGTGSGTINNLTIDNSAGVTLNRALTATGTLTMTSGNLNTTTTNLMTCASTSGGSSSSFVNGPLAISGSSYPKNFPIGKSTVYRPISVGASGGTSTIRSEMFNTPPTFGSGTGLARISLVRYFQVDLTSGSVTSPTITINYEGDDGVTNSSNLRVARSTDNNNWTSIGGTGSGAPSGFITSSSTTIEATTYFALGSFTTDNPLPVALSAFSLTPRHRSVELYWRTESETENAGFIISRAESENGPYQEIDSYQTAPALRGQGTTSMPTDYRYVDRVNIQHGRKYWYKLIDVDFNGNRAEQAPMSVETPFEHALDQNYPNPFNPITTIQFSLERAGRTALEIYNVLGQKVATLVDGDLSAGAHRYQWNASGLSSGVYFYRLRSGDFVETKKMVLAK